MRRGGELPSRWQRIDTPAMREAMQALQAALEEAERHLALYAFRRRSAARLKIAYLERLQAALPGESPGPLNLRLR